MSADRAVAVLGLGFGDCGKGLVTDALVRRLHAHTVLRFNGGAQAGHNVVLPDGRQHTFSQFGAGTFSKGVQTVLAQPVVVHPTALLEEAATLARCGVADAFERLRIDPRCRLTTPFHQAAGRLREWARGAAAHGSCGAGFGETVAHSLAHPDEALRWGDLAARDGALAKLEAIRLRLWAEIEPLLAPARATSSAAPAEAGLLASADVGRRWLELAQRAWRRAAAPLDAVLGRLARPGTIVCEGAQGILLDERHGFHPHTTWSATGGAAVDAVLGEAGRPAEVRHLGVIRSHHTRHGAGPLPSEDRALDVLAEPHNGDAGWQGRFRRGHFDAVLLRYAVASIGRLDGLVVTHLDALERRPGLLRWCRGHRPSAGAPALPAGCREDAAGCVVDLGGGCDRDAEDEPSPRLTAWLQQVAPVYDAAAPTASTFSERVEACAGVPVLLESFGPTWRTLRERAGRERVA